MQPARVKAAVESVVTPIVTPIQDFIRTESSSGIVLILAALVAFGWANSPWAASYFETLGTTAGVRFAGFELEKPLLLWVNDLLMAVFFFLVGLEIKRELVVGELKNRRRATLPIAAALGGMVVPAVIFIAFNAGTPSARGWGIPMATDIAFALGILALLGDRVSLSLKVFLLAVAIVDDLGAILVIALFYTETVDVGSLVLALAVWVAALGYGRFGAARPLVYALLGGALWYFMLRSGIHSTVAGVLLALTVPLRHRLSNEQIRAELRPLTEGDEDFEDREVAIERLEEVLERAHSPLHRMEHSLAPCVAFVIMPVFAFFNAGVALGGASVDAAGPVSLGIAVGLVAGKPLGILLFTFVVVRGGITDLPDGAGWAQVLGVGLLAGIGFTMSLFITGLAFTQPDVLDQAKVGVLAASVVAAGIGIVFLVRTLPSSIPAQATGPGQPSRPAP